MHKKILVVGDTNVDIIVPYPKFKNKERTLVEYPNPCLQGGGTAANTAVALARLGCPTEFVGSIGQDQYGSYIQKDFEKEKVSTKQLFIESQYHTVGVFAFIDEKGERYLWGWPREDQAFKIIDPKKIDYDEVRSAAWIHSSGMALVHDSSARSSILEIFKVAHEYGIPTSFDLNLRVDNGVLDESYKKVVLEVMAYSTYVLGSDKDELAYLGQNADPVENAKEFVSKDVTVIVRMGAKGSRGISKFEDVYSPAFHVDVEDTVGAGDVYNAGFIYGRVEGKSLEECIYLGNAVSAYTVARKGARSCPTKSELMEFLRNY